MKETIFTCDACERPFVPLLANYVNMGMFRPEYAIEITEKYSKICEPRKLDLCPSCSRRVINSLHMKYMNASEWHEFPEFIPEYFGEYIVTTDIGTVESMYFFPSEYYRDYQWKKTIDDEKIETKHIIAWREMPEAYVKEETDGKIH